jgi:hypothetical protein
MSPWLLWGEARRRSFERTVAAHFAQWHGHWAGQQFPPTALDWPPAGVLPAAGMAGSGARATGASGVRLGAAFIASEAMPTLLGVSAPVRMTLSFNARNSGVVSHGVLDTLASDLIARIASQPSGDIETANWESLTAATAWPRGTAIAVAWASPGRLAALVWISPTLAERLAGARPTPPTGESMAARTAVVRDSMLCVEGQLGEVEVSCGALRDLRAGDVLVLDHVLDSPAQLVIRDTRQVVGSARLGQQHERRVLRLETGA